VPARGWFLVNHHDFRQVGKCVMEKNSLHPNASEPALAIAGPKGGKKEVFASGS